MLGWFGGYGCTGTMHFFTAAMHIPAPLAFLAIAAEFVGGLALLVGFLARIAALGIAVHILVATWKVHLHMGFFMNWGSTQRGEGLEYHLLALALAIPIIIRGGGAFSEPLDRDAGIFAWLQGRKNSWRNACALKPATAPARRAEM